MAKGAFSYNLLREAAFNENNVIKLIVLVICPKEIKKKRLKKKKEVDKNNHADHVAADLLILIISWIRKKDACKETWGGH